MQIVEAVLGSRLQRRHRATVAQVDQPCGSACYRVISPFRQYEADGCEYRISDLGRTYS